MAAEAQLLVRVGDVDAAAYDASWTILALSGLGPEHGERRWDEVVVLAASMAELRRALPWLARAGRSRRVRIEITATTRPALLRVPTAVGRHPVTKTRSGRTSAGTLTMLLTLAKPVAVLALVRSALRVGATTRAHHTAGLRVGLTCPTALSWCGGDLAADDDEASADPPSFDVLVGAEPGGAVAGVLRIATSALVPPVDTAVCSPRGFVEAGPALGELTTAAGVPRLRFDTGEVIAFDPHIGLTENHLDAARRLRAVRVGDGDGAPDGALLRLLSQLCCAGVPVSAPQLTPDAIGALGADLGERLSTLDLARLAESTARESASIDIRRLALARFAPAAYWRTQAGRMGWPAQAAPTVSILLCTRRAALLAFALAQIARQDWPSRQVVVVLHGIDRADPQVLAALAESTVDPVVVEVGADVVFGHALNAGLARCSGELITKMDDDDWYGPHHLTDLVQAHEHSGAVLIGSGGYHLYLAEPDLTIRWTRVSTEADTDWVHGGTMLIAAADLRALGAWPAVRVGEDAHLIAAVLREGGAIYGIHDLGFTYYRGRDHTWEPPGGDGRWLDTETARVAGFTPPPQLLPLPHPWMR
ncbi:MAG: glycosyltransferase [Sporichthyaceae bacterium]